MSTFPVLFKRDSESHLGIALLEQSPEVTLLLLFFFSLRDGLPRALAQGRGPSRCSLLIHDLSTVRLWMAVVADLLCALGVL
eukprot:1117271-Pyramimonas_sp.AAC.1